jgi:uncharacterized protein YbjT (DUF2867 family)
MTNEQIESEAKQPDLHVVTGAFGFSGKYIAQRLLRQGYRVRTLTNSPNRANPFEGKVEPHALDFEHPDKLAESLRGAAVFYNTYWVRFTTDEFSQAAAVQNTLKLFESCQAAGVRRVVHISITNPSEDSPLEYFRGKARLERALKESGLSYAILRPAVLFGQEDILLNNIAWCLRHFPVFGVFGDGQYQLQPMFVDDLAALAVAQGGAQANTAIDAVGPETFTYRDLVCEIGRIIGKPRPILSISPAVGASIASIIGRLTGDVFLTRAEIDGLMQNLLRTHSPPAGETRLTQWAEEHAATLGQHYASEVARRRNRLESYEKL